MSAPVGGVVVGHREHDYAARFYLVDADRRLRWIGSEFHGWHQLTHPIPGDAEVLIGDVWWQDALIALANGEVFRYHGRSSRPRWHNERHLFAEGSGVVASRSVTLTLAGCERPPSWWTLWAVTDERQIVISGDRLIPERLGAPVPGDARILAVRLIGRAAEALLADGSLLAWRPGGWMRTDHIPQADLILGGCERRDGTARRWWAVTRDREVLVADAALDAAANVGAIHGTSAILAVRTAGRHKAEALTADGDLVTAFPRAAVAAEDGPEAA